MFEGFYFYLQKRTADECFTLKGERLIVVQPDDALMMERDAEEGREKRSEPAKMTAKEDSMIQMQVKKGSSALSLRNRPKRLADRV